MIKLIDLIIFSMANLGLAYIVTQSVLLKEPREAISNWLYTKYTWDPKKKKSELYRTIFLKLDYLVTCIICASVWTSIILYAILPKVTLIRLGDNIYDLLFLMCIAPTVAIAFSNSFLPEE